MKIEKEVYKIYNTESKKEEQVYNRSYTNQTEFSSPSEARRSNCWDIYQDRDQYKIRKYKVTYELIDEDVQ